MQIIVLPFANFIIFVPTTTGNSNCVVGIVEDVESVASVPGGDVIVRRSVSIVRRSVS